MKNILGANWRTTVSGVGTAIFGLLTALSVAPAELGQVAYLIPSKYKTMLFTLCAVATAILRIWNAACQKDRQVTGGQVEQDKDGNVAKPQHNKPEPPQAAIPTNNTTNVSEIVKNQQRTDT